MTSTRYYNSHAEALFARYAATNADELHADWATNHLRPEPGFACDIGAGSGRDANWLAAKGWEVVAVEPSALRDLAAPESHPRVVWMDDAMPDLRALRALGRRFDLILLSAVWMHVAPQKRERVFRILSELLSPSGLLVISLRKGGDAAEAAERGFHDTSADELIGYANRRAIALRSHSTRPDLTRAHLKRETLVFAMPDDGTGSLPLLRHVIVNDHKSATYKLGLLRTLVRIAETAPGLVIGRDDDHVDIPFGAVGLYWIKQFLPLLLHHNLPQRPPGPGGYGWARGAFYQLASISPFDLRLGAHFDADRAKVITRAINDACANIEKMPARHITLPGTDQQLFESAFRSVRPAARPIVLSRQYLAGFGRFRIPTSLWQTLGQYACWLDPVIVQEWRQLTADWGYDVNRYSARRWEPRSRLSPTHLVERQHSDQKGVCLDRVAYSASVAERRLGAAYNVEDTVPRERGSHIVVGLAPVLLKVHECPGDGYKLFLKRLFVQPGSQLRGNAVVGKLLGDLFHGGMVESATH